MVFHILFNGIPFCKDLGVNPNPLTSFDPALQLGMRLSITNKDPGLGAYFTAIIQAGCSGGACNLDAKYH